MSEPDPVIQTEESVAAAIEKALVQERAKNGRFLPKEKPKVEPAEPEAPAEPTTDSLLIEIETDLKERLKDQVDFTDIDALDQRNRIRMLRILDKQIGSKVGKKPAVDPTTPPPPSETHIPTLTELNQMDQFRRDIRHTKSYLDIAKKIRGHE